MTKFKVNFVFLADHSLIDNNGKLSIIGIFDKINLQTIPGNYLKFVLIGNFDIIDKTINDISLNVGLIDENNKTVNINIPKQDIHLPEKAKNHFNFMVEFGNLKFDNAGKYKFIVDANGEKVGEVNFEVIKNEQKSNLS